MPDISDTLYIRYVYNAYPGCYERKETNFLDYNLI